MSEDEIEIVVFDKLDDFKELLEELKELKKDDDGNYDEDDYKKFTGQINNIFNKNPEIKTELILQLRNEIKNRTGVLYKDIDIIIRKIGITILFLKFDDFKDLLNELDKEDFNKSIEQITNIFQNITKIDEGLLLRLQNEIKCRTGIPFRRTDKLINERKVEIKQEEKENQNQNTQNVNIVPESVLDSDLEKIPFDDNEIVIVNNKIYLIKYGKPQTILESKMEVLNKILDKRNGEYLYTFKIGDIIYPSYTSKDIIKKLGTDIQKGTTGKDVITHLIAEKSKNLPVREGIYLNGWFDGWYTPLDEDKKEFGIICYSDDQRTAYNNCKEMYKKYNLNEKKELKIKLQKFVKLTDMPEAYKAIIIGYCIIMPFRLYFIENFGIFPHLALYGRTTAGKTRMLDFWSTNNYKNRKKHMSGKTASSPSQIEGAMTGSTFGVMVDDYRETNAYNTAFMEMILKDVATGMPFWKRNNRDGRSGVSRELISSVLTTSNDLGELMNDSALNARTISLPYDKPIVSNNKWIKLELELKKGKLFSLMYDATKSWSDEHLDKLMKKIETSNNNILKHLDTKITDLNYPKLLKIYKIILAGCWLAKKIYGIELNIDEVWDILVKVRRTTISRFLNIFLSYCEYAKYLDPEKPIPRYFTFPLEYDPKHKVYIFQTTNLRDFNTFYSGYTNDRKKFSLKLLFERLNDALKHKKLIKFGYLHYTKKTYCIQISPVLITSGDKEPTKGMERISNILSINASIDEEHRENAIRGITPQDTKIEFVEEGEEFEIPDHNSSTKETKELDEQLRNLEEIDNFGVSNEAEFNDL